MFFQDVQYHSYHSSLDLELESSYAGGPDSGHYHALSAASLRKDFFCFMLKRHALDNKENMKQKLKDKLQEKLHIKIKRILDEKEQANARIVALKNKMEENPEKFTESEIDKIEKEISDKESEKCHCDKRIDESRRELETTPEKFFNIFLACINEEVASWSMSDSRFLFFIHCRDAGGYLKALLYNIFIDVKNEKNFRETAFKVIYRDALKNEFLRMKTQIEKVDRAFRAIQKTLRKEKYYTEFSHVGDYLRRYFHKPENTDQMILNLFKNNNFMPPDLNDFISSRLNDVVSYAIPCESLIVLYLVLRKKEIKIKNRISFDFERLLEEVFSEENFAEMKEPLEEMERMFSENNEHLFNFKSKDFNAKTQQFIDSMLFPSGMVSESTAVRGVEPIKDGNATFFEVALPESNNSIIFFTVSSNGKKISKKIFEHLRKYYEEAKPGDPLFVFIEPSGNAAGKENIAMLGRLGKENGFRPFKPCSEPAGIGILSEILRLNHKAKVLSVNNVSIAQVKKERSGGECEHLPLCNNCQRKRKTYMLQLKVASMLKVNKCKLTSSAQAACGQSGVADNGLFRNIALSHSGSYVVGEPQASSHHVMNPLAPLIREKIFQDPGLSREDIFEVISEIYLKRGNVATYRV